MEDLVAMIDHAHARMKYLRQFETADWFGRSPRNCVVKGTPFSRCPIPGISTLLFISYIVFAVSEQSSIKLETFLDFLHPLPICDSFKNSFFHIYCIDNDEMKLSALTALLSMALVGGTVNATWASVIIAHRSHILTSYVPHVISETEVEPWPPLWQESQWQLEILPARLQFPLQQSLLASF